MKRIQRYKAGQRLSATDVNEIVAELMRLGNLKVSPPLQMQNTPAGPLISMETPELLWCQAWVDVPATAFNTVRIDARDWRGAVVSFGLMSADGDESDAQDAVWAQMTSDSPLIGGLKGENIDSYHYNPVDTGGNPIGGGEVWLRIAAFTGELVLCALSMESQVQIFVQAWAFEAHRGKTHTLE